MTKQTLTGIYPITITPFNASGQIDEASLRRVVRFELEGGADGIGVGGFASEAYKLSDLERVQCAGIVADEVEASAHLIIGMAPGSLHAAINQARHYTQLNPTALMVLPPCTMKYDPAEIVNFYTSLGDASETPIMVQQSPQIPCYAHCQLEVDDLAIIADRCDNVRYFKIEGPGSADRIARLHKMVSNDVKLFGGVGGIAMQDELRSGAAGLLPGCGFNEHFIRIYQSWSEGKESEAIDILTQAQPLVDAVSGFGHEYSLHARKYLLNRAGIIENRYVRAPTVDVVRLDTSVLNQLAERLASRLNLSVTS